MGCFQPVLMGFSRIHQNGDLDLLVKPSAHQLRQRVPFDPPLGYLHCENQTAFHDALNARAVLYAPILHPVIAFQGFPGEKRELIGLDVRGIAVDQVQSRSDQFGFFFREFGYL
jgi:hypothetical protein